MTEPEEIAAPRTLTNAELASVAALWKRTGRELVTRFSGTSMQPAIADGAVVTLRCADDVSIGDVVAYVLADRVIVHRVVASWSNGLITRGDADLLPDPMLIERSAIVGKVVSVESEGGWRAPSGALPSAGASLILRICFGAARVGGVAAGMRVVRLLRAARARLRRLRSM